MQHVPCRGLRHLDVTAQLMRGNALLVAADKVHGHEPLDEGHLCPLEYSPDKAGEVVQARLAAEAPVLPDLTLVRSAVGADYVAVRPTALDNGLAARFLRVEVRGKGDDVVEFAEVYHSSLHIVVYCITKMVRR